MFKKRKKDNKIFLDEVFLDSTNLPSFDTQQFEGHIEKPISKRAVFSLLFIFFIINSLFGYRVYALQIVSGEANRQRSERNSLKHFPVFPRRGIIYDRNGLELAWNTPEGRKYTSNSGLAQTVGYVGYPKQEDIDKFNYHPKEQIGKDGLEEFFNDKLKGESGVKIIETDALGNVISESVYNQGKDGDKIISSIDLLVNKKFYELISSYSKDRGFSGGSGVIMDVKTGEILAIANYPEFDPNVFTISPDNEKIRSYFNDKNSPFLNRAVSGLYTPGSIVKPIMALGALNEGVISPEKKILSTGSISIPNPFLPGKFSFFKDWKAHGWVDMREAIALSSNVYFYSIGGGFDGQKGIGINNIERYSKLFGLGEETGIEVKREGIGVIPSPEWKEKNFDGEKWIIGDTYHTSIGQYGFLVTPLQMARAVAIIATDGKLISPTLLKGETKDFVGLGIDKELFDIVKEGMRMTVTQGTAQVLSIPGLRVAAKTGSAEVGVSKSKINAWITGFFPYENPKFSFAIVMEKGDRDSNAGAAFIMRQLLLWMQENGMDYVSLDGAGV